MHKLLSVILIMAFLGQTFNQGFYHLGYLINKADYEKNCVNKARPMLHCNGKCQLMKKIAEEEKKQRRDAPELKLAKSEVISSRSSFLLGIDNLDFANRPFYPVFNNRTTVDMPARVFHPPALVS